MIELTITKADADLVAYQLLGGDTERCAILFASRALQNRAVIRFVVRKVEFPDEENYTQKSIVSAELSPAFIAKISKQARMNGFSIIFVHSHPGKDHPQFSNVDDMGEKRLASFLSVRLPDTAHGSIVISAGGWRGRLLGSSNPMKVVSLGAKREVLFESKNAYPIDRTLFDRQVRAFGVDGQKILGSLVVGIVGLGGTGSVAAQQLAHLGVKSFILIDPDKIESTNLNRVVGANKKDMDRAKVDVAADLILSISPDASIHRVIGDATRTHVANELTAVDFIFSCTDSHGSRSVIQQIAYQYLVPCIDVGSILTSSNGHVTGIHGRVQALSPGLPCLHCSGLIDAEEVRRDMMDDEERQRDRYIHGAREPAPAVISINSTVMSLAITMFMSMVVGIPSEGRYVLYNGKGPTLRSVTAKQNPNCYICSQNGVLGLGSSQALFTRDE